MTTKTQNEQVFLSAEETAELIRSTPKTVYDLVQKNRIPFYRRGRRLLFKRSEIITWVENGQEGPVTKNNK